MPDFFRDVHSVFGLPFDAVSESDAVAEVRMAALERRRCFLSTPNLSFASGCTGNTAFRLSVVNSDLSVADGYPIVWLAQLAGAPLRGRVAGSNLFDRLTVEKPPPLRVYLFGGPDGAAERAAQRLRESALPGVEVVGWCSPGFKPVEAISGPSFTDPINNADPHFVLVALGAQKGQDWIERNWPRLHAPVISHLGAVINFLAGTVRRAPDWVQRCGLEWLWRIKEEPGLWRRYANDGTVFLGYLLSGAVPWALAQLQGRLGGRDAHQPFEIVREPGSPHVALRGAAVNGPRLTELRHVLQEACDQREPVRLDLTQVTQVGSSCVALLQLYDGWYRTTRGHGAIAACSDDVRRALQWSRTAYLLDGIGAGQA